MLDFFCNFVCSFVIITLQVKKAAGDFTGNDEQKLYFVSISFFFK